MKKYRLLLFLIYVGGVFNFSALHSQTSMINVSGRKCTSLNGKWKVIIDPIGSGDGLKVWKEMKPVKKTDFIQYSFEGGPVLNVPADFNTQMPELTYYEGTVWYKKTFQYRLNNNSRLFLNFGAVNYLADVYLNTRKIGSHEGGFTPFQFEITKDLKEGENTIIVRVSNKRLKDGIPGLGYDWFNYGGITREVNLIETDNSFIEDYSIQLKKHSSDEVLGWVKINGDRHSQNISIAIPELGIDFKTKSNNDGIAEVKFSSKFSLWSPKNPKLYKVIIRSETDTLADEIGFRSIEVKGTEILLNGKHVFFKAVNIHEENPFRAARAFSESDALLLLTWAKELGCNLVRLAHYPHNEHMVKLAEKMGLMVWDEIPVYQNIEFSAPGIESKMSLMMKEMIDRDKNRCGIVFWSLSNETSPSLPNRDNALTELSRQCRLLDSTRLVTAVINSQGYENNTFNVWDTLYRQFDVMSINEYLGWYVPWQGPARDVKWQLVCKDKPMIISEFGGEAKYGSNFGPKDEASSWREEYQEQIYKDQVEMFANVPNLSGVIAWLLVDYRSVGRMHPILQNGWNRKGVYSEKGEKKKAWYVLKNYYDSKMGE